MYHLNGYPGLGETPSCILAGSVIQCSGPVGYSDPSYQAALAQRQATHCDVLSAFSGHPEVPPNCVNIPTSPEELQQTVGLVILQSSPAVMQSGVEPTPATSLIPASSPVYSSSQPSAPAYSASAAPAVVTPAVSVAGSSGAAVAGQASSGFSFSAIPWWGWLAGAGAVVMMLKK